MNAVFPGTKWAACDKELNGAVSIMISLNSGLTLIKIPKYEKGLCLRLGQATGDMHFTLL